MNNFNEVFFSPLPPRKRDYNGDIVLSKVSRKRNIDGEMINTAPMDRLIPQRDGIEHRLFRPITPQVETTFTKVLQDSLLGSDNRVFHYNGSSKKENINSTQKVSFNKNYSLKFNKYKVLDAPDIVSDFSLELVHWSKSNKFFIALNNFGKGEIFFKDFNELHPQSSKFSITPFEYGIQITAIKSLGNDYVISGSNNGDMNVQMIGESGIVSIFNHFKGESQLNAIETMDNGHCFWMGLSAGYVAHFDIRQKNLCYQFQMNQEQLRSNGLVGMAYNQNNYLAASSYDGIVKIWDIRKPSQYFNADHYHGSTPVKCVSFNPEQPSQLLSGSRGVSSQLILRSIYNYSSKVEESLSHPISGIHWLPKKNHFVTCTDYGCRLFAYKVVNTTSNFEKILEEPLPLDNNRLLYMTGLEDNFCVYREGGENLAFFNVENCMTTKVTQNSFKMSMPIICPDKMIIR